MREYLINAKTLWWNKQSLSFNRTRQGFRSEGEFGYLTNIFNAYCFKFRATFLLLVFFYISIGKQLISDFFQVFTTNSKQSS